jgi:hypothetical protein
MIGRLFHRRREARLSLELFNVWEVDAPADVAAFVRALPRLLPPQSALALENTAFADAVATVLKQHCLPSHPRLARGTIFPRSRQFYVASSVCGPLADTLERHATPDVCDHFHAFLPDRVLLEWWDASCRAQWHLSGTFSKQEVESFCGPLGCKYAWLGA